MEIYWVIHNWLLFNNAGVIHDFFLLFLKLLLLLSIIASTSTRKIVIKSNVDRNSEFFNAKNFTFDQSKDDGKQPTVFKGDVMKSKTTVSENVQGKKNFKFA